MVESVLLSSSGIIPAYAGSTQEDSTKSEKLEGSSPHTRGAPITC